MAESKPAASDTQPPTRHDPVVPPIGGLAPYCSCGWPTTEGGKRMVWRYGDKTLAEHLREAALCSCSAGWCIHCRPLQEGK